MNPDTRGRQSQWRYHGGDGPPARGRVVKLRDLEPGARGTVHRLAGSGKLRRRLMDMGIVAGTPIEVVKVAPLGDPVELKFRGFHLTLRKGEAADILVEVSDE